MKKGTPCYGIRNTSSAEGCILPCILIEKSCQGMLRAEADTVAQLAELTGVELASILNMSVRNIHRLKADDKLRLSGCYY